MCFMLYKVSCHHAARNILISSTDHLVLPLQQLHVDLLLMLCCHVVHQGYNLGGVPLLAVGMGKALAGAHAEPLQHRLLIDGLLAVF